MQTTESWFVAFSSIILITMLVLTQILALPHFFICTDINEAFIGEIRWLNQS